MSLYNCESYLPRMFSYFMLENLQAYHLCNVEKYCFIRVTVLLEYIDLFSVELDGYVPTHTRIA